MRVIRVIDMLKSLCPDNKRNKEEIKTALASYEELSAEEKNEVMNNTYLAYKYWDSLEVMKKVKAEEDAKVFIDLLMKLDLLDKNYYEKAREVLDIYKKLSPMATSLVLRSEAAYKLYEAKAEPVIRDLRAIYSLKDSGCLMKEKVINSYNRLPEGSKEVINRDEPAKRILSELKVQVVTLKLLSYDPNDKDRRDRYEDDSEFENYEPYEREPRETVNMYEELSEYEKLQVRANSYAKEKIDCIYRIFNESLAKKVITSLKNLYDMSQFEELNVDYFTNALVAMSEFEELSYQVQEMVIIEAARELEALKACAAAHPIAVLLESRLSEDKEHKDYFEIADILVSAYDNALTDEQRELLNKNRIAMDLLEEAREALQEREAANTIIA
ncbi:hypothetical protein [Clostridium cylindrosporum]|uniref:Uncharacterized protein n=1 Tax=Clostridium cylindrosporum DSM 605 TaxID=1121307 RepID=A0A0J8D9Z3_CLOCY|nr:hypothetical protein [Clostridium cylindrosporum]KMT22875.1 hypothetical protein CLCY_5c01140 [Clostridium cylindrosporum DSM 605]